MIRSAFREVAGVARGASKTHKRLRDRLMMVLVATVGLDLVCATLAYFLERYEGSEVKTFGSALFWTSTQLLTVSSQLKNPISTGGRILDVFMEAYAIIVVATLAGALGAFLQKRAEEDDNKAATKSQ